jgi:hypothetical protein
MCPKVAIQRQSVPLPAYAGRLRLALAPYSRPGPGVSWPLPAAPWPLGPPGSEARPGLPLAAFTRKLAAGTPAGPFAWQLSSYSESNGSWALSRTAFSSHRDGETGVALAGRVATGGTR